MFVDVTTSVQFRPLPEKVEDAFYKLKNTTHQIQAYAYSGKDNVDCSSVRECDW